MSEKTPYQIAAELASHLPGEIYEGMEPAFKAFVQRLADALASQERRIEELTGERDEALEVCEGRGFRLDEAAARVEELSNELDALAARCERMEKALRDIAGGFCPGSMIDAAANAASREEAQRIFHMAFSAWMQETARAALDQSPAQEATDPAVSAKADPLR